MALLNTKDLIQRTKNKFHMVVKDVAAEDVTEEGTTMAEVVGGEDVPVGS